MKRRISIQSRAVTMIELMITMIIVTSLMTATVFTMSSYLPKQRLLDSMETLEQVLNKAQFEATSRIQWTCLSVDAGAGTLDIILDVDSNHGAVGGCGNGGDLELFSTSFSSGIELAGSCSSVYDASEPIWFDTSGVPRVCNTATGVCSESSYQIILRNPDLPSSARSRELELSSSGLIQIITFGEQGFNTSAWAKSSKQTGSGECE
ncbi:MAG: type II secretion system protein [Bdellovibrionales bacterium]|nr:type II secretion system protein [Bdellovibrionales bacterium]